VVCVVFASFGFWLFVAVLSFWDLVVCFDLVFY